MSLPCVCEKEPNHTDDESCDSSYSSIFLLSHFLKVRFAETIDIISWRIENDRFLRLFFCFLASFFVLKVEGQKMEVDWRLALEVSWREEFRKKI